MKTTQIATAAVGVLAILAGAAMAQTAAPTQTPQAPMRADADVDGRISQSEFVDRRLSRLTAVDANRDGSVSVEEMRSGRDTRHNQRASARFEQADADGNGALSREEFLTVAQRGDRAARAGHGPRQEGKGDGRRARGPVAIADVQDRTTAAFARMDTDRDGYLTREERRSARADKRGGHDERRAERMARRAGATSSPSTAPSE